jgi:ABC-type sugar transport system ATPase subunit
VKKTVNFKIADKYFLYPEHTVLQNLEFNAKFNKTLSENDENFDIYYH